MKRHWIAATAAAFVLALVASTAWVQDGAEGEAPRRGQRRGAPGRMGRGAGGGALPDYTRGIEGVTDQQRKQIADLRTAALDKIKEIEKQMNAKIKSLLTPAQVTAMEQAQRRVTHRGPGGVTMTDEQKKIMDDAREQAQKVEGREAKMEIMRAANTKVLESYTDEQKKEAARTRGRRRPGGEGGDQPRRRRPRPANGEGGTD